MKRLTRRQIIKKTAYITPIILTMPAIFSFASAGSGTYDQTAIDTIDRNDKKDKKDKKHNR